MKDSAVSVVCTVLNEQNTIEQLLHALQLQTRLPDELILCDGGSTDATVAKIQRFTKENNAFPIRLIEKKGNRSIGRNAAINISKSMLIAITDAGCFPEQKWLEELLQLHEASKAPVVAGYYRGEARTAFEEAVIPYALVMPDKVQKDSFLPATRSMLIEKPVWKKLGGFDESLSLNEDYAFAKRIVTKGYTIAFASEAVVVWQPRSTLKEFYLMIERFAQGDIQASIVRPKVILVFGRYIALLLFIVVLTLTNRYATVLNSLMILTVIYGGWAIIKNGRYTPKGWYWLPLLQVTADFGVVLGSIKGLNDKQ